jgi:hypothetical protein
LQALELLVKPSAQLAASWPRYLSPGGGGGSMGLAAGVAGGIAAALRRSACVRTACGRWVLPGQALLPDAALSFRPAGGAGGGGGGGKALPMISARELLSSCGKYYACPRLAAADGCGALASALECERLGLAHLVRCCQALGAGRRACWEWYHQLYRLLCGSGSCQLHAAQLRGARIFVSAEGEAVACGGGRRLLLAPPAAAEGEAGEWVVVHPDSLGGSGRYLLLVHFGAG